MAQTATVQIEMPAMGESVTEGTVLEWHVSEGDFVEEGDTVVEVSTDKVDAEVPAPAIGTITKLLVAVDDVVKVGAALGRARAGREQGLGKRRGGDRGGGARLPEAPDGGARRAATFRRQRRAVSAGETTDEGALQIVMPEMGESVTEGTVLEWHVAEGDSIEEGDTVVEVSTDKVDAEVPAPASGTISKLLVEVDDERQGRRLLAEITPGGGAARRPRRLKSPRRLSRRPRPREGRRRRASARRPPHRRRARGRSQQVNGSGAGGKVTKEDVLAAADGERRTAPARRRHPPARTRPLRGPAAMLANAMNESRVDPDRDLVPDARRRHPRRQAQGAQRRPQGARHEGLLHPPDRLGDRAGRQGMAGDGARLRRGDGKPDVIDDGPVNLGIAVDVERKDGSRSLMVPAIKGADGLDFAGFHSAYEELITKTRENKLTADDFKGTNISLTNPGGLGTIASVPRLMSGQGTIVATGSIAYPPEWAHATRRPASRRSGSRRS